MTIDNNYDNYYSIHMTKDQRYQAVIRKSLTSIYRHLEQLIESVEGTHLDTLDPAHAPIVDAVRAVEEEWILDVDLRRELSLLDDLH